MLILVDFLVMWVSVYILIFVFFKKIMSIKINDPLNKRRDISVFQKIKGEIKYISDFFQWKCLIFK